MGEIIHSAGNPSRFPGGLGGYPFGSKYNDAAMASAFAELGVVMTAAQYRNTYPDWVADRIKRFGADYVEHGLAHAGIEMTCLGIVINVRPQDAKP